MHQRCLKATWSGTHSESEGGRQDVPDTEDDTTGRKRRKSGSHRTRECELYQSWLKSVKKYTLGKVNSFVERNIYKVGRRVVSVSRRYVEN